MLEYDEDFLMDAGVPEAEREVLLAAVKKLKSGGAFSSCTSALPRAHSVIRRLLVLQAPNPPLTRRTPSLQLLPTPSQPPNNVCCCLRTPLLLLCGTTAGKRFSFFMAKALLKIHKI
jgi:hypothetical protein